MHSYRTETARQLRVYTYLGWLTDREHRRIADVVQLDHCQIVSTVSANKTSDIRGR